MTNSKLRHVYEVYIRTTPEKLWQAITEPSFTKQFFHEVKSDFKAGSPITWSRASGETAIEGVVVETQPPSRLVTTFRSLGEAYKADAPSRVTWTIEKAGDVCKLTLVHDNFDGETPSYKAVQSGWSRHLSRLKTLLETGEPLEIPAGC
jgi:uncharacterized protein YndB with AHSA1/START domain